MAGPDRGRRAARAERLGPLRAGVRRRRPAGAARQAPAWPRGDRAGLLPRRPRRRRGRPRRVPRPRRPRDHRRSRRSCSTRARSRASATCSPTRRCGAPALPPAARRRAPEEELDRLRRALRAADPRRDPRRRRPHGPLHAVPRPRGHCPRCGTAMARDTIGGRTTYWCPRCQPDLSRGAPSEHAPSSAAVRASRRRAGAPLRRTGGRRRRSRPAPGAAARPRPRRSPRRRRRARPRPSRRGRVASAAPRQRARASASFAGGRRCGVRTRREAQPRLARCAAAGCGSREPGGRRPRRERRRATGRGHGPLGPGRWCGRVPHPAHRAAIDGTARVTRYPPESPVPRTQSVSG